VISEYEPIFPSSQQVLTPQNACRQDRIETHGDKQIITKSNNQQIVRSNSHVIGGFARCDAHSAKAPETRKMGVDLNEAVVAAIVDKLGYSAHEVQHQVRHAL
jgi:hypothetical protein